MTLFQGMLKHYLVTYPFTYKSLTQKMPLEDGTVLPRIGSASQISPTVAKTLPGTHGIGKL